MVLVMVNLHRLRVDVRLKRIKAVWQIGYLVAHPISFPEHVSPCLPAD
jgi:hypothetical protein